MTDAPAGTDCVVGSANLDVVATVDRIPRAGDNAARAHADHEFAGGTGLNQAVVAARSGS